MLDSRASSGSLPVFERDQRDIDEIEFDFFDEAPAVETGEREAPPRRSRLRRRPPTGGGNPRVVRLAAAIAAFIALMVVLVIVVNSCRAEQKKGQYESYMQDVGKVGAQSAEIGKRLNKVIFSSGIKLDDLRAELDGLRREQSRVVATSERLKPPGPLREQQESLLQTMLLRVNGLNGLSRAFGEIASTSGARSPGVLLAGQSDRLVASDVIYQDFFQEGSKRVLGERGITGVVVPESQFVRNREVTSPTSWRLVVARLTKPPAAGGLHGNQIVGVRVRPGGRRLSPTDENTVRVSTGLAFEVLVKNSGDNQETQVRVNLTIQQSPQSIRKERTIDIINPGDTKAVVFGNLSGLAFGPRTIVKVTVEPVPGEENTNNNAAEYVVVFTLG